MNIVTRSARRDCRYLSVSHGISLADMKAQAHRSYRHAVNRTLKAVLNGHVDADEADYNPRRENCVTGWEVI